MMIATLQIATAASAMGSTGPIEFRFSSPAIAAPALFTPEPPGAICVTGAYFALK